MEALIEFLCFILPRVFCLNFMQFVVFDLLASVTLEKALFFNSLSDIAQNYPKLPEITQHCPSLPNIAQHCSKTHVSDMSLQAHAGRWASWQDLEFKPEKKYERGAGGMLI